MTAPNANTLWAEAFVEELGAQGVSTACVAPGSRSTPLTVAIHEHEDIGVYSHLDERSAAYFALGRGKVTGEPTPLICTSGTAAANFHPAVIEANQARVPMLVLTADRPPELQDSGANQTIDQEGLYGDAVRWERTLPEPEADPRKLRALRTTAARAVTASTHVPAGPVHLNVPFRKPLEPTEVPGDVPDGFAADHPRAGSGREGPYVETTRGETRLTEGELDRIAKAVERADRGLIVAGPADAPTPSRHVAERLASATGFPILADPLSGLRFGDHVAAITVLGGYDAYLDQGVTGEWPDPEVVIRFGASPTSKALRNYLERTDPRQFLVDPAGGWREATFTATDLVEADPTGFAGSLADRVNRSREGWTDRLRLTEEAYRDLLEREDVPHEGEVARTVVSQAPESATLFVSNSMPVRDVDRFALPESRELQVLGNRGASGIDGITSTALGAGSATDGPLVVLTGDLAYYHDMNGLLALSRCDVPATVVEINNDGGGIFHMLPIADHETFENGFKTPHGLDFSPTGDLYDLAFRRVGTIDGLQDAYEEALSAAGSHVIEVTSDAAASHATREELQGRVRSRL